MLVSSMLCAASALAMSGTNRWSEASYTNGVIVSNAVHGRTAYYIPADGLVPMGFGSDGNTTSGTVHQAIAADNYNALYERDALAIIDNSEGDEAAPAADYIAYWSRANHINLTTNKIYITNELIGCYADPANLSGGSYNTFFGANNPSNVAYGTTNLCAAAGVPTNWFEYTPWRNLDTSLYGNPGFRAIVKQLTVNEYREYAGAVWPSPDKTNLWVYQGFSTSSWADAKANVALSSHDKTQTRAPHNKTRGVYYAGSNTWQAVQTFCWQYYDIAPPDTNWACAVQLYAMRGGQVETFDAAGSGLIDGQYALVGSRTYTAGVENAYITVGITNIASIAAWCGDPEPEADDTTSKGWDLEDTVLENGTKLWLIKDFGVANGWKYP